MDNDTFDKIVESVYQEFLVASTIQRRTFKNEKKEDLIKYHSRLGIVIRNDFKLWEYSWEPELVNGADASPNHPDAISMRVIEAVWEKVQNEDIEDV